MEAQKRDEAVAHCEAVIEEQKQYNNEHNIFPSCNVIADRLLERRGELIDVYEELQAWLAPHPHALHQFFEIVLSSAAFWNPDKCREAREGMTRLKEINEQIADKASELADLLSARSELGDSSGIYSDTHSDICETLDAAARTNFLFQSWVKKDIDRLHHRFESKYWPSFPESLEELAREAYAAEIHTTDEMTAAAISGTRASMADFLKAFFEGIEQNKKRNYGSLPSDFQLTDKANASLLNCVLGLEPDYMKDAAYVKRFQQAERQKRAQKTV